MATVAGGRVGDAGRGRRNRLRPTDRPGDDRSTTVASTGHAQADVAGPANESATDQRQPVRPVDTRATWPAQDHQLACRGVNNEGQGSRDCTWDNDGGPPENGWVIRFDLQHDASYYLGSTTGAQVAQVAGFPAVQSSSAFVDPKIECILVVDVAPGENLQASYQNLRGDYPGINHQVACQLADQVAEMAVKNLRRLAG
jgi:hypothetical protein